MNIIGIIVVTISINTFGMAYFGLDQFPTWAIDTASAGGRGCGVSPSSTNAAVLANATTTVRTILTTAAMNLTTITANATR